MQADAAADSRAAGGAAGTVAASLPACCKFTLQLSVKFLLLLTFTMSMSCDLLTGKLSVTGGPDRGLHPLGGAQSHVPPGGCTCPTGT